MHKARNGQDGRSKDATERQYDLAERTARFAEAIVGFAKSVPQTRVTLPLVTQLVRAGTSVGANNCEADNAVSRRDFRNKIGTCRKESAETKFWLRMIAVAAPSIREEARDLWREANELHLIFAKSFQTAGKHLKKAP
jgi:four helix bundle protein